MAKDEDYEGVTLKDIKDGFNKFRKWSPWKAAPGGSTSGASSSSDGGGGGSGGGGFTATPAWLPLPKIVMAAFMLNMLMILIGLIVSGLVLGGTIVVNAKAIGLTESLVMISCIFGLAYMCCHLWAARRPDPLEMEGGLSTGRTRTPRHTKIIVLGRITIALWAVSLLATAITLGSQPASESSSKTPLQAGLAAAIINCIDMTVIQLVVERTRQPFVLPWLTPPIPEGQTSAAKALIDGILGDGISGHPYAGSTSGAGSASGPSRTSSEGDEEESEEEEEPAPPPPPITPKRKRKTRVTIRETADPNASTSTLAPPPSVPSSNEPFAMPSSGSTLVERQELWSRVDEGGGKASSIKLPPPPPLHQHHYGATAAGSYIAPVPSPMEQFYPPQPTYMTHMSQSPGPGPPQMHMHPQMHPQMHMQMPPTMPIAMPSMPPTPSSMRMNMPPRPPLSRSSASGFPRYSAAATSIAAQPTFGVTGPRPLYEAGRMHSYTAYVNSRQNANGTIAEEPGRDQARSVPPMGARPPPPPPIRGRKMFDKAIRDLKESGKRDEPVWEDYSNIRVPGSFVDM